MKGLLAVTWREIVQRRMILVAAVFASLVVWAVPLVRGLSGIDAAAARHLTALALAAAFAVGTVVALGATMLAPAISSGRIAFDLARPLSAFAVWCGRMMAALALAVTAAVIVGLSSGVGDASMLPTDLPASPSTCIALALAALVFLFAFSHAVSVAILSRSAWIAIDVALGVAAAFTISAALTSPPSLPVYDTRVLLAGLVLAIGCVAGYLSVSRGRVGIRAAHRAISLCVWIPIVTTALGLSGYARWVNSARPDDLRTVLYAIPAPEGDWVLVEGAARGAESVFLFNTADRRYARLNKALGDWPVFSRDGKRAAWIEGRPYKGPFEVRSWDLDRLDSEPSPTRLILKAFPALLVLSDDGSRLATVESGILAIHDVAGSRTLASAKIAGEKARIRGFFVSRDLFRVYVVEEDPSGNHKLEVQDFDLASKTLAKGGAYSLGSNWCSLTADRNGDRLIVIHAESKEAILLDGRDARVLASLAPALPGMNRWCGFLADGRILLTDHAPDRFVLRVFTRNGTLIQSVPFPKAQGLALGGEAAPGKVIATVGLWPDCRIELVDVDTGQRRALGEGLFPAGRFTSFWDQPNGGPTVGSKATTLFYRLGESLVRIDPVTGKREVLLGKGAR